MYPNLLGQKMYYHLTDDDMGKIIGVSRNSYNKKMQSGKFWANECQALCKYFEKSFEYLFALEDGNSKSIQTKHSMQNKS